ncbi:hypothetical protein E3T55_06715 [Cryobacterium frigoriphilum]|uniref:Uncharacterized protein n=1 Tax=Cryobacterium frigoriphilum TaxID=1259150 RepID=A0A4V3IRJ5_9MICO|nr:hypothetical protein [Cryobacterium frigoriphilum]TFD52289.1 hypothetical protein E3T55_06715 [Cryobacterium frigoriphilum]
MTAQPDCNARLGGYGKRVGSARCRYRGSPGRPAAAHEPTSGIRLRDRGGASTAIMLPRFWSDVEIVSGP